LCAQVSHGRAVLLARFCGAANTDFSAMAFLITPPMIVDFIAFNGPRFSSFPETGSSAGIATVFLVAVSRVMG
jgi:hypothetical protein